MTEPFDLTHRPYIVLVRREDVEVPPEDPVQAAVYAPATVCCYFVDHDQTAASTSYAYLVETRDGWGLTGPGCLQARHAYTDPRPWRRALDQRETIAGTGLDVDWRSSTLRKYWRLVSVMALMFQVEPGHKMLKSLLKRATDGTKREFTPAQKRTLLEILRERGGLARTVGADQKTWDAELRAHHRVAKQRRDLVFRLGRLSALDLRQSDCELIESLRQSAVGRRRHRMEQLSPDQVDLIERLERRHFELRRVSICWRSKWRIY